MANEVQVVDAVTIAASQVYMLTLMTKVCNARDLSLVDGAIKTASKIRLGLKALDQPNTYTGNLSRQQILMTLNNMCGIYNQQTIQITT